MKKYQKANMVAKNVPAGSYTAGCPYNDQYMANPGRTWCVCCQRAA